MKIENILLLGMGAAALSSCGGAVNEYKSYEMYPVRTDGMWEMEYAPENTRFALWAPTADEVRVLIYDNGENGHAAKTVQMERREDGTWTAEVKQDLIGKFYTFNVKIDERWQGDTPGINARAVGVNGKRAAIIDMRKTNPAGWEKDGENLSPIAPEDIILYEMHHRDFSVADSSGMKNKGKYLALTERGTHIAGMSTGIDHLKELGVTHVHLLPSFDFGSIDETRLDRKRYNWGYDPVNYNVPEGSYSTDPYNPSTRIREFKQMVQALHNAGLRVVMDVVFNHTFNTAASNFEKTVPGYFYRELPDGKYSDASGCGNETASNREMMRRFMIESVVYWMSEYHIDGFRFDLMGIHDIETMNAIRKAAEKINPSVYIYGEGWAAGTPAYDADSLAMKANVKKMPHIAVFSDELRDGLRGPFSDDSKGGFLTGVAGGEESIKYGIAGAVAHPQVKMDSVNYTHKAWAAEPVQMISYVSCHDDLCLGDRLKSASPSIKPDELIRLDKLAQTVVFTSQGVPFIYAGEELLRDKKGVRNSYKSSDSVNAIDWNNKIVHADLFNYYKNLIAMRRHHPAFHMGKAEMVRKNLKFLPVEGKNLIAFELNGAACGDRWSDIIVIFNSRKEPAKVTVPEGKYTVVCRDGEINEAGMGNIYGPEVVVPMQSATIIYK